MKKVKFSQILDFQKKSHMKAGDGLKNGSFPFFTSSPVLSKHVDSFQFASPSLIFGTGGSASVHVCEKQFSVSTDCLVAQLKDDAVKKFEIKYIFYYLSGNISILENGFKGAGLKHISKEYISNIDIPEISLEEQKQIVKILDEADALRQKRKEAIGLLDEYVKSVFLEMFGDPVTNSMDWSIKTLGEIAYICSGVTKGRKFKNVKTVNVQYMRVANVQDGRIDLTEIKEIEVLPNDVEKYRLLNGDILLTEGGDPDKLGRGGIWKGLIDDCIHQNHIFRVRLNIEESIPEYISAQIGSSRGKKYFLKSAKQTTGIATINITQLKSFPVLIPPIQLQIRFSAIVNNANRLKEKMIIQAKLFDNQFLALMQKSFFIN
jgi:type I restriction enzyme S subunit